MATRRWIEDQPAVVEDAMIPAEAEEDTPLQVSWGTTGWFRALPQSCNDRLPAGMPLWESTWGLEDAGERVPAEFLTVGLFTVKATCWNMVVGAVQVQPSVQSVQFTAHMDNDALDTCPNNGGWRIFPGKKDYNDPNPIRRNKVTVTATVFPPVQGVEVHFKWWDVDDPSDAGGVIDPNDLGGVPRGNDNKDETGPEPGFSGISGRFWTTATTAVSNGIATASTTFTITRQPGDNFRIVACTDWDKLMRVTDAQLENPYNLPGGAVMTPMLTVWRRLFVERDAMQVDLLPSNTQNGNAIQRERYSAPNTYLQILPVAPEYDAEHQFENGVVQITGVPGPWPVAGYLKNSRELVIPGARPSVLDSAYSVGDDDYDENFGIKVNYPRKPYTEWLEDAYKPAYILPVINDDTDDDAIYFRRNINWPQHRDAVIDTDFLYRTHVAPEFWAVHLVSAHQGHYQRDNDPDTETQPDEYDYSISHHGALIYLEVIRDVVQEIGWGPPRARENQQVVIALGLLAGCLKTDGAIMNGDGETFSNVSINRLRSNPWLQ
jgi:hypothetical protein